MTLIDHLRELRGRMFKSVVAIVIGFCIAWWQYDWLFDILIQPFTDSVRHLAAEKGISSTPFVSGVANAFLLQTKICLVASIVLTSPVWLYQIWAFVLPGLHSNERKWTMIFVGVAGPLFLSGVLLGYYVLPKGLEILIGFTPGQIESLVDVNSYFNFTLRVLLVFGVAFEIPLFVVLLNLAGVVSGKQLGRWRAYIVFATFVFAAVATPSTDPITMLFLALPMTVLFMLSEMIARFVDYRRGRGGDEPDLDEFADDEISPISLRHDPSDELPGPLDDD
jgi:sec-independent protein translocase protein TatC